MREREVQEETTQIGRWGGAGDPPDVAGRSSCHPVINSAAAAAHPHGAVRADRTPRRLEPDFVTIPPVRDLLLLEWGSECADARRGFGKASFCEPAPLDRGRDGRDDLIDDTFVAETAADAQAVAPCGEGEDRSIAKAVAFGETSHLEAVRDRDALEPKLIAQEAGHELRAE